MIQQKSSLTKNQAGFFLINDEIFDKIHAIST